MVLMPTTAQKSVKMSAETDAGIDVAVTALGKNASYSSSDRASDHSADRRNAVEPSETDVLVQLRGNLAQLEDMHDRMKFMMGELSYLLVKRS